MEKASAAKDDDGSHIPQEECWANQKSMY